MAVLISIDDELRQISASCERPRMLLHCCCAPCARYVLEYLSPFFEITTFFYNPNIQPREEFYKRLSEMSKLPALAGHSAGGKMVAVDYDTAGYDAIAAQYSAEPEGGKRCRACFELRLGETAKRAKEGGFDYFTSTLSVSPHKNAE